MRRSCDGIHTARGIPQGMGGVKGFHGEETTGRGKARGKPTVGGRRSDQRSLTRKKSKDRKKTEKGKSWGRKTTGESKLGRGTQEVYATRGEEVKYERKRVLTGGSDAAHGAILDSGRNGNYG